MQQVNPDGAPSILSDMINNALPPPMVKDAKTNELAVSHVVTLNISFILIRILMLFFFSYSTFQKYYKMVALRVQNQQVQAV